MRIILFSVHIQEEQVDHITDPDMEPVMIKGRAIKKLVLATHSGPSSYSGQAFQTYCSYPSSDYLTLRLTLDKPRGMGG